MESLYKAAPEFITYIKDMKSQAQDGRTTYTAEELMTLAENKYEARLLDNENAWGQLSEEQEKIVVMSAENDLLKRERCPATTTKTKASDKQRNSMAKTQNKKKEEEKNKWAWKDEPPTPNVTKEDNIPIKTVNNKKYYWCPNHSDGKGKWVISRIIHGCGDCELFESRYCVSAEKNPLILHSSVRSKYTRIEHSW